MTSASSPWVGARVLRDEDPRLVRGGGNYLEDQTPPDCLLAAFVRSPLAHARIKRIDTTAASALPGVQRVVVAADLGSRNGPIPVVWQLPGLRIPLYRALAEDTVRYVGEPIAMVLADDRYLAEDAADLIEVEYDPLPISIDSRAVLEDGAVAIHPDLGTNEAYRLDIRAGDPEAVFAAADLVFATDFEIQRHTAVPMERRGIIAEPDRHGGLTVWATIQHPHLYRRDVAPILGLPEARLRVIAPDVGGAFGVYYEIYPEDVAVAGVAMDVGRPVKWVEDRRETFLATNHARQQSHRVRVAASRDGKVLAIADDIVSDIGAYVDYSGVGPSYLTASFLTGPYDIQCVDITLRCAFTNKVRGGAYRGFGAPQAAFVMERVIDQVAHRLSLDPLEVRRRNFIRPEQFPYRIASGATYDSGSYSDLMDLAAARFEYQEMAKLRDAARAQGRRVGIGTCAYTEFTGTGPSKGLAARGYLVGGYETVTLRIENDGSIVVLSGVSHIGQGIRTAIAQICADGLGVRPEQVTVLTGDTGVVPHGNRGSIGSRSAVVAGQAAMDAANEVREKAKALAAYLLEASTADLVVDQGRFFVAGSPERHLTYRELGRTAWMRHVTPDDMEPGLEATVTFEPPAYAFASGVHMTAVEVDASTGWVKILRYAIAHDCGRVINPMIVEGQVMGASAQGIGGALLEELAYDDTGQLLTSTLMDYLLPTAMDVPRFRLDHLETPAPFLASGVKGAGEGGTLGPPAALANAVSDALGVEVNATPLSPERLWIAMRNNVGTHETSR